MSRKTSCPKPEGWEDYYQFLLRWEGRELENVPGDAGGLTKYGVDQRSHPGVDIAGLSEATASVIHLQDYCKTDAGKLPEPLSFLFFDMAMNAGNSAAVKCLQRVTGVSNVDGVWGKRTQTAVDNYFLIKTPLQFVHAYSEERERHYKNLAFTRAKLAKFLNGWLNRTASCKAWIADNLKEGAC